MFISETGVAEGTVINRRYKFDWKNIPGPDEEAWVAYKSGTYLGKTIIRKSGRTVSLPQVTEELHSAGDRFKVRKGVVFHSVSVLGDGAVTLFLRSVTDCNNPNLPYGGSDHGLILQPGELPAPPESY